MTTTLDTGWIKSGRVLFWIGPFALFASTGLVLLSAKLIRKGFSQPWWSDAIPLALLLGLTGSLTWILFRGIGRERIWITNDRILIQRSKLTWKIQETILISDLQCFELDSTAEVFDVRLRLSDGGLRPLVTSLSTQRMAEWTRRLADVAPITGR